MLVYSDGTPCTPHKSDTKYKIGDKVLVKSSSWYFENRNEDISKWVKFDDGSVFGLAKANYCGHIVTIESITDDNQYTIVEDDSKMHWSEDCFECGFKCGFEPKFNVGDKVLCWDGCPGVIDSIETHEGQIRYNVSFGGGIDLGYYKEKDLIEYHKLKYITGDFVGIYGYETDVKIQQMRWDGSSFMYKVYLADEETWITADDIAYKVEPDKTLVVSGPIKAILLSARDRGRIDEIIKALEFLEKDKMICYADEIKFLKKIRSW